MARAVTDRMKYGIKASAVFTENLQHNFKAVNGRSFTQQLGNEIIFEFPGMGEGYYCDFAASYFRFGLNVGFTTAPTDPNTVGTKQPSGYVRFDRGPESIFRRIQIFDASGNLLENYENYNDLYCATELMTNNSQLRSNSGMFHGEGLLVPRNSATTDNTTNVTAFTDNQYCVGNPFDYSPQGFNANTPYTRYPDLGGIIVGKHATYTNAVNTGTVGTAIDLSNFQNATQALAPEVYAAQPAQSSYKYFTFQLLSALFGGSSDKYIPMSGINGMRIVMTLEDPKGAFVMCGLNSVASAAQTPFTATIYDPTMFLSMVKVDPYVDVELRNAAKAYSRDGLIRISSQTWTVYTSSISAGIPAFEFNIPLRVSSLKAIYFTFSRQNYSGTETFRDFQVTRLGCDSKSTWFDNGLSQYVFYVDGKPFPPAPVQVKTGYSEALSQLGQALHIGNKGADGLYLSLLANASMDDYRSRNFILGQEFESFNGKGPVIESGYNCLNSTLSLRLDFDNTKTIPAGVQANGYGASNPANPQVNNVNVLAAPVACYLKVFCLYDCFLSINDDSGVMRTEV